MKVSVVGAGYVGLVSGVCLASKGHDVVCVDVVQERVDQINSGRPPIYERGLDELLQQTAGCGLVATTDLRRAVLETELSIIAVGTPFDGAEIDLTFIQEVSHQIGEILGEKAGYHVVIVKSTVVPGTTDTVVIPALEKASGKQSGVDFGVGMNPEFLREGEAVADFMSPDRIVMGGMDERTLGCLEELYEVFEGVDKLCTTPKTAEMIKYTANALLATMISFSNEIGNLSATLGEIDVVDVMKGVHLDKRLSPILEDGRRLRPNFTTYLEAGCGFGGSCFPKDVKALIAHGHKAGQEMVILDAVMQVNEDQPLQVLDLLHKGLPDLESSCVAVLGLAFKPGTDDIRDSPAIPIMRYLQEVGAAIKAYDPVAEAQAKEVFGHDRITYCKDLKDAIADVDAIVILTRWDEFKRLPVLLSGFPSPPLVIDGRRMLDKHSVERYAGIGL